MVLTQPDHSQLGETSEHRFHTTMVLTQPEEAEMEQIGSIIVSIPLWFSRNNTGVIRSIEHQ